MDLQDLLSSALTEKIGKNVGADSDAVGNVLQSAIPALLSSMNKNSGTQAGAEALTKALFDHADDDDDVDNVDQEDGEKIINHILGDRADTVKSNLSKVAGNIDTDKVGKILSMAAPLLLGSLGSQAKKTSKSTGGFNVTDLLGGLLGGGSFDIGSLLGLGGDEEEETAAKKTSAKKTTSKKTEAKKASAKKKSGLDLEDIGEAADTIQTVGGILGSLFGKKKK